MHAITTRSPTGIQEKWLPLLVPIQDSVKLPTRKQSGKYINIAFPAETTCQKSPMGKEHPSSQERMWLVPREFLESFEQRSIDTTCPKFVNQLVVVDRELLPVRRNGALDVPWGDDLLVRERRIGWFDGCSARDAGGAVVLGSEEDD
jgi:hypothetical protein